MLSIFNRDKHQEKIIRQGVTENSSLVAQRSAELRDNIPKETNHPTLNAVKDAGSKLAEEGDLLLEKLDNLSALKKPAKKLKLKTLKVEGIQYSKDVATWDTAAITSLQSHKFGYLTPSMSGATTRNNSASTSSSTVNEPYVHPANYWDWALVDKINEAGKTPPVKLIRNRTTESEPDIY
ncbi:hypothetical protein QCA50_003884 [Cerrena zonata]|uniref:Uncharacterized protein n=1 Tax=Cerrena zonata TaxID=2478898 RepID=A0AAW0GRS1_9APHY